MESGIIVASVPIAVPSTTRESGNSIIIKITNGNERSTFTIRLINWYGIIFGAIPRGDVTNKKIPSGNPRRIANKVENKTMTTVSQVDCKTSSVIGLFFYLPHNLEPANKR